MVGHSLGTILAVGGVGNLLHQRRRGAPRFIVCRFSDRSSEQVRSLGTILSRCSPDLGLHLCVVHDAYNRSASLSTISQFFSILFWTFRTPAFRSYCLALANVLLYSAADLQVSSLTLDREADSSPWWRRLRGSECDGGQAKQ